MISSVLLCLFVLSGHYYVATTTPVKPHILFIVADDLGWNDVSWHNRKIIMPTLDKMAHKGVILNSSYTQPMCSPSRAALMTGYYPFHLGMQHGIINRFQPKHLPTDKETLPEALKNLGYATHMVGKWHLGFCNWNNTPTYRGFDSFYGFYSGAQDYYDHVSSGGYDFRWNTSIHHPPKGRYSTSLFGRRAADIVREHNPHKQPLFMFLSFQGVHSPLQVPKRFSQKYKNVKNRERQIYNGMITAMDEAVAKVMTSLRRHKYMDNLLVVFTSDNGAASYIAGSNWPLRGSKATLWEGGTRVPTFVYSKNMLKKTGIVHNGLVHASDWFPTLISMAGGTTDPFIDGKDQWLSLSRGWPSPRTEFVYNINELKRTGALRMGNYKLIVGKPGRYNSWYPEKTKPACNAKRPRFTDENQENDLLERQEEDEEAENNTGGWFFSRSFSSLKTLASRAKSMMTSTKSFRSISRWYDKFRCDRFMAAHKKEERNLQTPPVQLFNIKDDPLEKRNLAGKKPMLLKKMMRKLKQYKTTLVPAQNQPVTKLAHPKNFDNVWSPGWC